MQIQLQNKNDQLKRLKKELLAKDEQLRSAQKTNAALSNQVSRMKTQQQSREPLLRLQSSVPGSASFPIRPAVHAAGDLRSAPADGVKRTGERLTSVCSKAPKTDDSLATASKRQAETGGQ